VIEPDEAVEQTQDPRPSPLEDSASVGLVQRRSPERWLTWL
jgi:hypothetical protein